MGTSSRGATMEVSYWKSWTTTSWMHKFQCVLLISCLFLQKFKQLVTSRSWEWRPGTLDGAYLHLGKVFQVGSFSTNLSICQCIIIGLVVIIRIGKHSNLVAFPVQLMDSREILLLLTGHIKSSLDLATSHCWRWLWAARRWRCRRHRRRRRRPSGGRGWGPCRRGLRCPWRSRGSPAAGNGLGRTPRAEEPCRGQGWWRRRRTRESLGSSLEKKCKKQTVLKCQVSHD